MALIHTGNGYIIPPKGTTLQRPASPTIGMLRYNIDMKANEVYNGSRWESYKLSENYWFKYRTIYTRGYMLGGYKDSSPWRNVNQTNHSTDITNNLGDVLDNTGSYLDGGFSDYYAYVYSMDNTVGGSGVYTTSFNMTTNTGRTHDVNWDLKTSRTNLAAAMNPDLTIAYITGGGSAATDKHNLVTEIMMAAGSAPSGPLAGGTVGGLGKIFGEFKAWFSQGGGSYLLFSNETWYTDGMSWATDGQPKGLSSKHGFGYGGTGTYSGSVAMNKMSDITGITLRTVNRVGGTQGEENFEMGQDRGYQIGGYNGSAQNNISWRVHYPTDTFVLGGADMQPKGHDGASSGACATASSQILGGI